MKEANSGFSQRYILCSLFFMATLVSLQHAWVPGFFSDGYLYAAFGKNAALNGYWLVPSLTQESYNEFFHHTPFIFILEGVLFKVFGASYVTARIFPSLFFLLSILVIYRLKEQMKDGLYLLAIFFFITTPPLIKKVRFPNIDLPLMLFFFVSFCFFYMAITKNKKNWYGCGLFFGLSLLCKGPVALLIPTCVLISLALSKRLSHLKSSTPWLGLILGGVIFSLWPLALGLTGKFYVFENWFEFTFIHTIKNSRGDSSPVYTYLLFLIKNAPLWFFFTLIGTFYSFKSRNFFQTSILSFFWGMIIFLSFASFKYSNYIIPAYPFMAILAAIGFTQLLPRFVTNRLLNSVPYLFAAASLVLLVFPITNEGRRDRGIFEAKKAFKSVGFSPSEYYIVDGVYPYWNLNSLNAWEDLKILTRAIKKSDKLLQQKNFCKNCAILASEAVAREVIIDNESLNIVAKINRGNFFIIVPKSRLTLSPMMVLKR